MEMLTEIINDVLNHLNIGVVLFDSSGSEITRNSALKEISKRNKKLRFKDSTSFEIYHENVQFQKALDDSFSYNFNVHKTPYQRTLSLYAGKGKKAGVYIRRYDFNSCQSFDGEDIVVDDFFVAVFISDYRPIKPDPGSFKDLFRLTPTESRLVMNLMGGMNVRQAAEAGGVTPQTARNYLKSVFSKTGAHTQADLCKTILSSVVILI